MVEHRGWLLDLYEDATQGLVLWLLDETGPRRRLWQPFTITFYVHGPFPRLRQLWQFLRTQTIATYLSRTTRRDLFAGVLDILAVEVVNPATLPRLFRTVQRSFPNLTYYDVDIPLTLRYAVAYDVFPLCYCEVVADDDGRIHTIAPLESRWQLDPSQPPLRVLTLEPDVDPAHREPRFVWVDGDCQRHQIPFTSARLFLISLQASVRHVDPDIILTRFGDTWLLPKVIEAQQKLQADWFNLNRDEKRKPVHRKENSYHTYGQVVYRGQQVHLYGRFHIDQRNAMMFGEYGLEGTFEQARVTGLPIQEVARKSPGSGVTAMQMQTALRQGVLVPHQKQQAEGFKTAAQLIRSDRGGLVYQPLIGLHENAIEVDFVSMYPAIMSRFNISPETVGKDGDGCVPELGISVYTSQVGLVPMTLRPLLGKRIGLKERLLKLTPQDCRVRALKARSNALKWLLVVCFGYLGYKNARFGRIESHEAVTAYGRECLLRAKEAAEALGYTVLHMYVDGLWVKKEGVNQVEQVRPLLNEITERTGLPITLEGIYRWVAFLPSRLDERVPVANRYFGVFQNGKIKTRGIETRRHDTPPWIAQAQLELIQKMSKRLNSHSRMEIVSELMTFLRQRVAELRNGRIPLEQLLVSQRLSLEITEYRVPSPACKAAMQLAAIGKPRRPGQRIRFWFVRGEPGVHAWDLEIGVETTVLDYGRYTDLLLRAASTVLQPLGVTEVELKNCVLTEALQLPLPIDTVNLFPFYLSSKQMRC